MNVAAATNTNHVLLSELLPRDLKVADSMMHIPDWAFRPDQWTAAFLRGLTQHAQSWNGKRVWEIGVGTGGNLVALRFLANGATFYFSDFDSRCVPLASRNIATAGASTCRYYPLHGSWDLVTAPEGKTAPKVDIIFGCIPQVPSNVDLSARDNVAHYYNPQRYPNSHLNPCGLGLVEALLQRAPDVLSENGQVVLNLAGRPGIGRLEAMFAACGFASRVLYQTVIAQHKDTSLESLAALEKEGHGDFEFFSDPENCNGINARLAEWRRGRGMPVYHRIYVIEGTMA